MNTLPIIRDTFLRIPCHFPCWWYSHHVGMYGESYSFQFVLFFFSCLITLTIITSVTFLLNNWWARYPAFLLLLRVRILSLNINHDIIYGGFSLLLSLYKVAEVFFYPHFAKNTWMDIELINRLTGHEKFIDMYSDSTL